MMGMAAPPPVYAPGGLRGDVDNSAGDELSKALPIHKANTPWTRFAPPIGSTTQSWKIQRKGMDGLFELKPGTANPEIFKRWREKMADHISTPNELWEDILDYCRKRAFPISTAEVKSITVGDENL